MKNKSVLQSILTGVFAVLALAASNSIVRAQCDNPTWNRVTGNWDDPINWSPNCVPDFDSDASINNGGSATISDIPNSGIRPTRSLKIGDGQGNTGSLNINVPGATGNAVMLLVNGDDFYIGNQGKGNLSIVNYGAHAIRSHSVHIGAQPGSTGTVDVSGSGEVWQLVPNSTLFIGCTAASATGGTATLNIQFPAFITIDNNSPTSPGIKVGQSGTLNGSGIFVLTGPNDVSVTAEVFGTLALQGSGPLIIDGILDLTGLGMNTANTIFHVTPQAHNELDVYPSGGLGGWVTLGGRITVIMTGTFTVGQSFTLLHAETGRQGSQFATQSILFLSGGGPPICPLIAYVDDPIHGTSDVVLRITSCSSSEDP